MQYTLGVDIGGTFTDFSLINADGEITLWKEASTLSNPTQAIKKGVQALADLGDESLSEFLSKLDLFVHGQTITFFVIQRNGPKTALLCTDGFRDIIHFRDGFKPGVTTSNYNLLKTLFPDICAFLSRRG